MSLPLIGPGIFAGALLAFTLSLDDFVVGFFTTGPGATTCPSDLPSVKRGLTQDINALSRWCSPRCWWRLWLSRCETKLKARTTSSPMP
jgi:ABC-type spermidine/putrescine transport system permease subunit II